MVYSPGAECLLLDFFLVVLTQQASFLHRHEGELCLQHHSSVWGSFACRPLAKRVRREPGLVLGWGCCGGASASALTHLRPGPQWVPCSLSNPAPVLPQSLSRFSGNLPKTNHRLESAHPFGPEAGMVWCLSLRGGFWASRLPAALCVCPRPWVASSLPLHPPF